jgi:hypothetical protein
MPAAMVKGDAVGLSLDDESDELIRRLANKYDVSLQAMIIRPTRLGIIEQATDDTY